MSTNQVNTTKITIEKTEGITHALKRLVESKPNSVLSDEKITLAEWNTTIDKLIEINEQRTKEGKKCIFTGGTDRKDYKTSFVVHTNQEIEFTESEINQLYEAMGVTFSEESQQKPTPEPPKSETPAPNDSTKTNPANPEDPADSTSVVKPVAPADTTKVEQKAQPAPVQVKVPVKQPEKAKKSRFSLSWSEIGKQAWKSTKNFVKGMFCDKKGFSLKRTATTIGIIAGLALAAPAAAALGASAGIVAGIALTTKIIGAGLGAMFIYSGGKKTVEGTKEYFNAENRKQAEAGMEKAMNGAVELASIPIIGGLLKAGSKFVNIIYKGKSAKHQTQPKIEPKAQTETKPSVQEKSVSEIASTEQGIEKAPIEKPSARSTTSQTQKTQPIIEETPQKPAVEPSVEAKIPEAESKNTILRDEIVIEGKVTEKPSVEVTREVISEPKGRNVTPREFAPHNYQQPDIPNVEIITRAFETDYRHYDISSGKQMSTSSSKICKEAMMAFEEGSSDVSLIIGKGSNGQKYVAFNIPSGRYDEKGRTIRNIITLTSEPGKDFLPVQIDAIKTIMSLTPEQLLTEYPLSRGIKEIGKQLGSNDDISISLDVILREITHFSKGKELPSNVVEQINSIGNLQPGNYIELLQWNKPTFEVPKVTEPASTPKQPVAAKTDGNSIRNKTTVIQNNIRYFTTSNGQNFSYNEGSNTEMFKITQISKDEATITLTDDVGLRQEMAGIINSLTKQGMGIIEFFQSKPSASQLVATKPGRLKLIDGEWKLIEQIQVTAE